MTKASISTALAILLAAVVAAGQAPTASQAPTPSQGPTPQSMMRMYDQATEINFNGIVEEVKLMHHGRGMTGTHLIVKTGDETKEVMLGPSNFISGKGFTFAKGDSIELTGSKVTVGGTEYIIAREVVKDGKTLTLRNKNGTPEWAGMGMGKRAPGK